MSRRFSARRLCSWKASPAAIAAAVLACLSVATAGRAGPGDEFERLIDRYLELRWQAAPAAATEAGVRGYDDKLPDLSVAGIERSLKQSRDLLAQIRAIDPKALSKDQRIDHQLLVGLIDSDIREQEQRQPFQANPELYVPFSALAGLMDKETIPLADRLRALHGRLEALPRLLASAKTNLKNPAQRFTESAIFQAEGTIRFLRDDVNQLMAGAGAEGADLGRARDAAITSLEEFGAFLKTDLLPRSKGNWVLGRENYDYILQRRWFLEDDADAILAKGQKAFADTERLLNETAARIEPGKTWVDVYERLKNDHPTAEGLKAAYQAQMDAARDYLKAHDIVTLPEGERVTTVDTPPALRRSSPFGTFDSVGPFEQHLQGRLVLTPIEDSLTPEQRRERLRSHHNSWIPIIAVHEAYPGHHVQALKANQNPRVLRRVVRESIFAEGWGLYCEEMMWEQGFLKGDDVRLTQLRNRLWRAARVIIDVGLHTGRMTFEEGVQLLVDKVRFERYAAELEVGMYTRRPTTVLGYLIGMMEIQDMRVAYEKRFGAPKQPKDFYDRLLAIGALPPGLVRRALLE